LELAVLEKLPSKKLVIGVIDLNAPDVETPEVVAERIVRVFPHVPPERLIVAPDCGMKYLPRATAYSKLCAMVEGARLIRARLS
jgi:5-methyltetrahydropteroyltriglutamate--homocysteine methyltransferase